MPRVFVIGQDWTFRAAVRAELLELGMDAMGFASWEQAKPEAQRTTPEIVVIDATSADVPSSGLPASSELIVITSVITPVHLPATATILRKPLRVGDVVTAVRHRMEGHPA